MAEEPDLLGVGGLRAPELARERAAPEAAIRAVGIDDPMTGVVHVLEGIRLRAAGREERELGVQVGMPRQVEDVSQGLLIFRPRGEIQAMVEHDHEVWKPVQ